MGTGLDRMNCKETPPFGLSIVVAMTVRESTAIYPSHIYVSVVPGAVMAVAR